MRPERGALSFVLVEGYASTSVQGGWIVALFFGNGNQ
jgi:hypothetical protein